MAELTSSFRDYSRNGHEDQHKLRQLMTPFRSTTAMAYGEYTLDVARRT